MAPRERLRRHGLTLLGLVVVALFAAEIASDDTFAGDRPESLLMAVVLGAAVIAARWVTLLPLATCLVLIEVADLVNRAWADSGAFLIVLLAACYLVGRRTTGREFVLGLLMVLALIPLAMTGDGEAAALGSVLFFAGLFGAPVLVGRMIRFRMTREGQLTDRAQEAERDRDEAIKIERQRIARELHDVVAHSLNVIVLQARGGRSVLETAPQDTAAALEAIDFLGQQGLAEMRRMLGLLREDGEGVSLLPQPGLDHLDQLAEGVSASGLPVTVEVVGTPVPLTPGMDVSAYRIVQEALTNALKHAGKARATVQVGYSPGELSLCVEDDGPGSPSESGSGLGLAGMRERVQIYGGTMQTGPRAGGGFAVRVLLPIPS